MGRLGARSGVSDPYQMTEADLQDTAKNAMIESLSWGPLLTDYGALARHDTTCLENWTMDGDYLYGNFGARLDDIHVVTDSNEVMQVSWGPLAERAEHLSRLRSRRGAPIGKD
jgi:hypothetical protein